MCQFTSPLSLCKFGFAKVGLNDVFSIKKPLEKILYGIT